MSFVFEVVWVSMDLIQEWTSDILILASKFGFESIAQGVPRIPIRFGWDSSKKAGRSPGEKERDPFGSTIFSKPQVIPLSLDFLSAHSVRTSVSFDPYLLLKTNF